MTDPSIGLGGYRFDTERSCLSVLISLFQKRLCFYNKCTYIYFVDSTGPSALIVESWRGISFGFYGGIRIRGCFGNCSITVVHRLHGRNKVPLGIVRSRHGVSRETVGLRNCIQRWIIHPSGSNGEFLFDDEYVFHQKPTLECPPFRSFCPGR